VRPRSQGRLLGSARVREDGARTAARIELAVLTGTRLRPDVRRASLHPTLIKTER